MAFGKKPSKSRKARALQYSAQGWPVVPLHTVGEDGSCSCAGGAKCSRPGKHPRTLNGVTDATTDGDQIRKWWTNDPRANVGIAAGAETGILVLDIDRRHGGVKTLEKLQTELGSLPATVTAKTGGGGHHLIFEYPSFSVRKDTTGKVLGPGVDILSDGCIMVAPPSRHASGKRYGWQQGSSPPPHIECCASWSGPACAPECVRPGIGRYRSEAHSWPGFLLLWPDLSKAHLIGSIVASASIGDELRRSQCSETPSSERDA
jgi:putative DNA primase/helicase